MTVVRNIPVLPVPAMAEEIHGLCRTVRSLSEDGPVHVSHGDLAALLETLAERNSVDAFYREHEQGMAAIIRDSEVMPVGGGFFQFADRLRDVMAAGWTARGKRHARILAACGHAADFQAWRSLARKQGLSDGEVIQAMVALTVAAAGRS